MFQQVLTAAHCFPDIVKNQTWVRYAHAPTTINENGDYVYVENDHAWMVSMHVDMYHGLPKKSQYWTNPIPNPIIDPSINVPLVDLSMYLFIY